MWFNQWFNWYRVPSFTGFLWILRFSKYWVFHKVQTGFFLGCRVYRFNRGFGSGFKTLGENDWPCAWDCSGATRTCNGASAQRRLRTPCYMNYMLSLTSLVLWFVWEMEKFLRLWIVGCDIYIYFAATARRSVEGSLLTSTMICVCVSGDVLWVGSRSD